jgi:hypothetical protein
MAAAVRILGNDGFEWLGFDLREVLDAIGPHRHLRWSVDAEDWVGRGEADPDHRPWPEAELVLSRASSKAAELTWADLERMTGVVAQFIDATFTGYETQGEPVVCLKAIDSSFWIVWVRDAAVLDRVSASFDHVEDYPEPPPERLSFPD